MTSLLTFWRLLAAPVAAILVLLSPLSPARAEPAASPWSKTDNTSVRLIASSASVGKAGKLTLGLQFKMRPGWKIYWRSPGDAGYPPSVDWSGSSNLKSAVIGWPPPHRFTVLGLESVGYKKQVVLPLTVTPSSPGQAVSLRAKVDFLTCSEICVPIRTSLTLDLPAGPAAPSRFAQIINRYSVLVPAQGKNLGLQIKKAEIYGAGNDWTLRITATADDPFETPDVFVEGPNVLVFDKPVVSFSNNKRRAVLAEKIYGVEDLEPPGSMIKSALTFTLVDGDRAAERALPLQLATGSGDSGLKLITILALAVLGGLILNLMPCVLPVLSIKLLSVVGHGGRDRRDVRLSFIASAAGIIAAFLVLAGALAGLKLAGMTIGWGIQFQQPVFLILMTIVITLFACNLWGFFNISLPHAISNMGNKTGKKQGLGGHFMTGAFATVLATPCSAPFLGTALGFALARSSADIFAVFTALGIGLALPYLLIAAAPGLATRLPRPGRWMVVLRRVMGFALAATAVWLISVLITQIGQRGAYAIGLLMLTMILAVYLGRRLRRLWLVGGSAVVVMSVLAMITPSLLPASAVSTRAAAEDPIFKAIWKPFDEKAIPGLVASGKTVFVDVTADWCITCKINKGVVLARGDVLATLRRDDVVAMQADWTLPSDLIASYLASFGRYGIPFDAVYGPAAPRGVALPELLSRSTVMAAFAKASPKKFAALE